MDSKKKYRKCQNCEEQTSHLRFCSPECKTEWHVFNKKMGSHQFNVLDVLMERYGGPMTIDYSYPVYSLAHMRKIPLIEIIHEYREGSCVMIKITDTGKRWWEYHVAQRQQPSGT